MTEEERNKEQVRRIMVNGESPEAEAAAVPAEEKKDWRAEAEKNYDLFLRAQADMENMKKRLEREKADFMRFANENIIKELLPVVDNLERAMNHAQDDGGGLLEGVRLTYEGLRGTLERFGVKPINAAGGPFDPNFHEAVMQRENPDVEDNTVLEEVQKGYLLHERLIRPAMVIVSRRPSGENGGQE
ncbi:MAG: nucleotide exchange factor GrpE [Thermodesulfobacteriota bacterium]